ncbi:hypothetical protein [Burkholderia cenocepacia]|uniref:hypothetical protein n=1 Tax=Burkholderia cenocepacia TaxID=95486 RepID=UPI002230808B|nr:hypothetical protein [Burkholderia cenocepacia]MCW3505652.1 hypothetical protein [Burkholderia cenocepacia]MCW3513207.1 hypothetical protein [Burkholderia cenocepacia]MCW3520799.1 hypothetical protein [Burkholderia cenocepacia]MCW3535976.1 hypothetical protein [Burkholderia cenocepacia]MCW3551046.1 hypothetical protein [Burkholderia cenocepacia]
MQVKAIKPGFFAGARKYAGDVFDMPGTSAKKGEVIGKDSKPVTWVVPAEGETATGPKARGRNDSTSNTDPTTGSGSSGGQDADDLQ